MKLTIAHLYPELLNIYGDKGNVLAFINRCNWRGIETELHEINPGDDIDSSLYDFYFIGGGQDQQQIMVADELQRQKTNLAKAVDENAVFLAICGGYQLFGHYYKPHDGDEIPGISLMDAYTVAGNTRFIGNVTINTIFTVDEHYKTLVGFENHSGLTYLGESVKPLGIVKIGNGNNGKDKTEGAVYKNIFGTYLHGSLLPKNPHFTDYLISLALEKRYKEKITLDKLDDELEFFAHQRAINKKY